jgi:kumamolisin
MAIHPYFKLRGPIAHVPAGQVPWSVPDLCMAYSWPVWPISGLMGGGVIAIVELGGGWLQSDMEAFFKSIDMPVPSIIDVSVDGTKNTPGQSDADYEVALDIQVAAASYYVATGTSATIRVYWAQDIATAVQAATKDGCDVCSISWGADETEWGPAAGNAMEAAAIAATAAGMVVLAAAGDNDSSDGGPGQANVDLPASAPHVIGCGGTTKVVASEVVWNNDPGQTNGEGTGGGYSSLFAYPSWQIGAPRGPGGRMVPDVSANANPNTGYEIIVAGQGQVVGGTSAVAPLWAGLLAACGRKLGFITPKLYQNQGCFSDITVGGNGMYNAGVGPDPCTGIGVPIGTALVKVL